MPKADLIAAAEACESATEGSRALDLQIERKAVGSVPLHWRVGNGGVILDGFNDRSDSVPDYTTSLDAAVTLVPKGWGWLIVSDDQASVFRRTANKRFADAIDAAVNGTPARALCAAALRALAETE